MSTDREKKEKLLVEFLLSDKETFVLCYNMLRQEYFSSPLDNVIEFVLEHFQKHSGIPSNTIIETETGVKLQERDMDTSERSYLLDEIETLCQDAAMEIAILNSADLVSEGNRHEVHDLIREALSVKIDKSIGIELFDNAEERIKTIEDNVVEYSCGIKKIDDMLGSFRRAEFYMVYAITGGGKSLFLGNATGAFSAQSLDVAVISLELNEHLYAKRLDAMMVSVDIAQHKKFATDVSAFYEKVKDDFGSVTVKKMNAGATASDIEAYLLEYHLVKDKYPDVIIVDYISLMGLNSSKKFFNRNDADHEKAIGLIRLAGQYDMICFSAGQINREGYDVVKVNPSHCAGGMALNNDCDGSFAMVATEEDLDNDQIQAVPLKIRHTKKMSGSVTLYRNSKTLRFTDEPSSDKLPSSPLDHSGKDNAPTKTSGKKKLAKALSF